MITFYGAPWCGDCIRSRRLLDTLHVSYVYINIEEDAAAVETILRINHGKRSIPVFVFPDDTTLTEPSNKELTEKLTTLGLIGV